MGKDIGNYIPLAVWYELAFTVDRKLKHKIHKLGKCDDRTPILQLTGCRTKKTRKLKLTHCRAIEDGSIWERISLLNPC